MPYADLEYGAQVIYSPIGGRPTKKAVAGLYQPRAWADAIRLAGEVMERG